MTDVTQSRLDLIGGTPLLEVGRLGEPGGARVWAKLEYSNPSGSVKDRIALTMIEAAERRGDLAPGGTVVEPTSGHTGIALAWVPAGANVVAARRVAARRSPGQAVATPIPDSGLWRLSTGIHKEGL